MLTFLKAQMSSLIASATDYLVTVLLVKLTGATPGLVALASVEGAVCGGIVNFIINRRWVFSDGSKSRRVQVIRYILVWTGSMLLNATGMYLVTYFSTIDIAISKILVSLLVGFGYNYFLQKRFVFK
jgi:putative flippase GtrA